MPSDQPAVVDGLEVNEVRDGLTVYDSATDRIHYLNATAAIVFAFCDGQRSASDMAGFIVAAGLRARRTPARRGRKVPERASWRGAVCLPGG
jgi:hypothetical protein